MVKRWLAGRYARWMYAWETALTTRDTNRVVRPMEWGFDWLAEYAASQAVRIDPAEPEQSMMAINQAIVGNSDSFFGYETPKDFRLEQRYPQLYPTNVRPETLKRDALLKQKAAAGKVKPAQYLRFTSPVQTHYPENDLVNARWYPADPKRQAGKPKQAMIVMPQWNADAFSHNALCAIFNRFGVSALRLSKPYHDVRRPAELERSDYAVSANLGRTIATCRQAVIDVRCCIDWLESQGYEQFGVLGTSLGSCYGFIASAHDPRIRVNAFNHAATWFGDVVWTGQSTRHIRASFEQEGITQDRLRALCSGVSPREYMDRFAAGGSLEPGAGVPKRVRVIYAPYDLTFLREFSEQVVAEFTARNLDFDVKVLPCGHYTTGETPFQYMDGWYLGSFVYQAFKRLAGEPGISARQSKVQEQEGVEVA